MKVTINTKNRGYKEEYLKKEENLGDVGLLNLYSVLLTNIYGYVAYVIYKICGEDKTKQSRMIDNICVSVKEFLDHMDNMTTE